MQPLRIAYISYEFPPETAFGGISTYTYQVSDCMRRLHCEVEVFAGSLKENNLNQTLPNGVVLHRIKGELRETFRSRVAKYVTERHAQKPFDIIEGPEYGAEGIEVKKALPQVPFVVKFHIPTFYIKALHHDLKKDRLKYKLKNALGIGKYNRQKDAEYRMTMLGDAWVAPSQSMAQIIADNWAMDINKIAVIPNPLIPSDELLQIPIETNNNCVTYMGRLEARKGVHLLAQAIPAVLQQHPKTLFRFIGKTNVGPDGKGTMMDYLKQQLAAWPQNIEFVDYVPPQQVPQWLAQTDICVFNSLWENFGYVCLEAMSAGRGIVASQNGGMYDMLHDIDGGILVDPLDVQALQKALIHLLQNGQQRMQMGARCRQKAVDFYGHKVPRMQLQFYHDVVAHCQKEKVGF
ncbi:MAG: glycosyltransferase family 4 protein [Chitinophagaceae bacterium]